MPKVASIKIDGYDLRFMSSDHMPPHFHWEKAGKWKVRVHFTRGGEKTFDIVFGPGPTGAEQNRHNRVYEGAVLRAPRYRRARARQVAAHSF